MKFPRKSLTVSHFFFIILLLSTISLLLNYHVGSNDVIIDSSVESEVVDVNKVSGKDDVNFLRRSLNQHSPEDNENVSILARVHQLEQKLYAARPSSIVLVVKDKTQELVYRQSMLGLEHVVVVQSQGQLSWLDEHTAGQKNLTIMFCVDREHCPERLVNRFTKINRIKEIEPFVSKEEKLCNINKRVEQTKNHSPSSICDVNVNVTTTTESRDILSDLPVKTANGETTKDTNRPREYSSSSRRGDQFESVMWHLPQQPVHYQAGPVVRVTALLTALQPVRLYVHPAMATGKYRTETLIKFPLSDLLQYISETSGSSSPSLWWSSLKETLLRTLLTLAHDVTSSRQQTCPRCFQLLDVDMICSHVTSCSVIMIQPSRTMRTDVLRDTLLLVSDTRTVTSDVISGLDTVMDKHKLSVCGSDPDSDPCLSEADLTYIRDLLQERGNIGPWIQIHPDLRQHAVPDRKYAETPPGSTTGGATRYSLVTMVTRELTQILYPENHDSVESQLTISKKIDDTPVSRSQSRGRTPDNVMSAGNCSKDAVTYGEIGQIFTLPNLNLTSTSNYGYVTHVPYDVILVNVFAMAKCCGCDVRINDINNTPSAQNLTVGLGENRIKLLVVESTTDPHRIIRIYTLIMHRISRSADVTSLSEHEKLCELQQDCSMPLNLSTSCGLQESSFRQSEVRHMMSCESGDHEGRWVVPCAVCSRDTSCDWRKATWQPRDCSYRHVTRQRLKSCLHGKRLLFLGDSTNRGILNYVMDQLNGSFWDGDKTHTSRVYRDVNNGSTMLSFAYYPHFWLPIDHRPTFHKILYQIIKRSLPLENNDNTVLMLGGVHWLAKHHIDLVLEALDGKGLSNITKVIKGIGAGFHQPLSDVIFVPASEQTTIKRREDSLVRYAKSRGFKVVSTFQMTLSRYKDFQEGKCACHFHKLSRLKDSPGGQPQYTVEGEINEAYSQIFLHQLCR